MERRHQVSPLEACQTVEKDPFRIRLRGDSSAYFRNFSCNVMLIACYILRSGSCFSTIWEKGCLLFESKDR